MTSVFTPARIVAFAIGLLAVLFAAGWLTREDPGEAPLLDILGGGFIFNYRVAEMYYGFTAVVVRPLASGSIIEAAFEDPAGGAPLVVRERVSPMTNRYDLRSPPVLGVKAKAPYKVAIRVLDRQETQVLWTRTMTFTSNVDGALVPEKPLTIGPGYHRNPQAVADQR